MRNPTARFVSAVHARKRKGQATSNVAWSKHEACAIHVGPTNDRADTPLEPLRDGHGATAAMTSLSHTTMH